jgi:hypothetical protein
MDTIDEATTDVPASHGSALEVFRVFRKLGSAGAAR